MFEKLGTPAFLREAREGGEGKPFSLWRTLLVFLLVYAITNLLQSFALTPVLLGMVFSNGEILSLFSSGAYLENETLIYDTVERMLASNAVLVLTLFATALVALTAIVYCRSFEKRSLSSMGLRKRRAFSSSLIGCVLALLLLGGAVVFCFFFGACTLSPSGTVKIPLLLFLLLGFFVQSFAEEVLFRGYLMASLGRGMKTSSALLLSAHLFAFFHQANAGVTPLAFLNLFLFGVLASLYMIRTGSLFGTAVLHAVWNIAQGLLFGSAVSGQNLPVSLFSLSLNENAVILNGGAFGLEGGLAVTCVLSLGVALLGMVKTRED